MSIIYTGIFSVQGCVVQSSKEPKINDVLSSLISNLDLEINVMRSFGAHQRSFDHTIQVIIEDRYAYVTACTSELNHTVAFRYLKQIIIQHGRRNINTPEGRKDFEHYMFQLMDSAPNDPEYNPSGAIQKQIDYTTNVIRDNIQLTLDRGDDLTNIADTSQRLSVTSTVFSKSAKTLKCAMFRNDAKMAFILILQLLFIALCCLGLIIVIVYVTIKW